MNIFSKVFIKNFNGVFIKVLLMIFIYVFSNLTNATTPETWRFKVTRFYSFPPTSERTHDLLASLSQLDFLLLPFLLFLCITSNLFLHCFVFV